MSFFAGSVRKKLLLLVLVSMLPALGVILYSALRYQEHLTREAKEDAAESAAKFAESYGRIVLGAKQLLGALALVPEVHRGDVAACAALFRRLIEQNTAYVNINLSAPNGDLIASALPSPKVNYADRKSFRDALASYDFSAGEYVVGKISREPMQTFAYPVLGPDGRIASVLQVALRLAYFAAIFQYLPQLPPGSTLTIADHKGLRLYRHPPDETHSPIGQPMLKPMLELASGEQEAGSTVLAGPDGVRRIYAFQRLKLPHAPTPYGLVVVGIPEGHAFRQARSALFGDLALFGMAVLLGLAAARLFADLAVGRKVGRLVAAARRLGQGDLTARADMGAEPGEFGELARTFDEMTEALARDIAERERARSALAESEEKLRTVADFTYDWEYWRDPLGNHVWVSPSCERITGYTAERFRAEPGLLRRIVYPEDQAVFNAHIDTVDRGGSEPCDLDFRIVHRDGRLVWLNHHCQAIRRPDGTPLGRRASNRDITERKLAEQALRAGERQIRALFNATTDSAMLLDSRGTILAANEEAARRRGVSAEDLPGKTLPDVLTPELAALRWEKMEECAHRKGWVGFDETRGELRYRISIFPILDEADEVTQFAVFSRDVTEQIRAEEALRQALAHAEDLAVRAEAANRAKSVFLATMSHELRTPLNGILGMLQLLKLTPLSSEQKDCVTTADSCGKNLLQLLNDILDLSKIEAGKVEILAEPFRPAALLAAIRDTFRTAAAAKGLELTTDIDPAVPALLFGDEVRLKQVLFNLVGNAVKFTEKGRVAVRIEHDGAPEQAGRIRLAVTVSDTGVGIPPDKQASLFEPFTQADGSYSRKFQGAGLGLAIVKRLVELLGGEVGLKSAPGQGTAVRFTFQARLPRPEDTAHPVPPVRDAADEPLPQTARLTVLLAEDEAVNRIAATRFLERLGHRVLSANNGVEVLDILAHEPCDVVLMDVQMPVMDGVEATRRIRSGPRGPNGPDIPIIAMTAFAMSGDRERLLAAGMNGYVAKPMRLADIARALDDLAGPDGPGRTEH